MTEASRPLTLSQLERFLGVTVDKDTSFQGYLDAAAVLAAFDPFQLRPTDAAKETGNVVVDRLLPRCEPITEGPGRGLWTLSLIDRRAALRRLGTRSAMRKAMAANPDRPALPMQRMLERVLAEDPLTLEQESRENLVALFALVPWFEDILENLPALPAVEQAIGRLDHRAPMRRLAGSTFVGRTRQLRQLTEFLWIRQADETAQGASSLFVHGPGGVGKSTLLAQFILRQVEPLGVPWVYLDIDRPVLRPQQPLTLLLDALEQLHPQLQLEQSRVDSLSKDMVFAIGREDHTRSYESAGSGASDRLVRVLSELLAPALADRPLLLVVDTFEEAEFLGADVVWPLLDFLLDCARLLPNVRLLLAGRALPSQYLPLAFPFARHIGPPPEEQGNAVPWPYRPMNLVTLDQQEARDLLAASVSELGLPPLAPAELDEVIAVVTRNPMCLKLAARVLLAEGLQSFRQAHSDFLTRLRAEKIQALLYGRILGHLHSADARALTFPGLVVRRITPRLIREVLSEPCGLKLTPTRNEFDIFEALRTETGLVEYDPEDGSLRHRGDVRRAMLEDLQDRVDSEVIERIDVAAVAFYAAQSDPISRAEEIYHRLRLGQPESVLNDRWRPEAARHLKTAGPELPARAQIWLARLLGVTLDESVRRTASQEEWEDQAARSAVRYLSAHAPEMALSVLQERSERTPKSKLFQLEADTYRSLGKPEQALRVARAGLEAAGSVGAIDLVLELLLQMVVIEEGRGRLSTAERLLHQAATMAQHSAHELLRFRVSITELRLHRQLHPTARVDRAQLRDRLVHAMSDDFVNRLRDQPVLLREAAAELGKVSPRLASMAIETLGLEVSSDHQASALGQAVAALKDYANVTGEELIPRLVAGVTELEREDFRADVVREWTATSLDLQDVHRLSGALASAEAGTDVLGSFRDYFRAGVDQGLGADAGPSGD